MTPLGFDSAIPKIERPQSHALIRAATGIGVCTALPDISSPKHAEKFKKPSMSIMFTFNVLL